MLHLLAEIKETLPKARFLLFFVSKATRKYFLPLYIAFEGALLPLSGYVRSRSVIYSKQDKI